VIGRRHVQHGLLESGNVTLGEGNLQLDGLVPAGSSGIAPSYKKSNRLAMSPS
jgi:hypothetical protein